MLTCDDHPDREAIALLTMLEGGRAFTMCAECFGAMCQAVFMHNQTYDDTDSALAEINAGAESDQTDEDMDRISPEDSYGENYARITDDQEPEHSGGVGPKSGSTERMQEHGYASVDGHRGEGDDRYRAAGMPNIGG